MQMQYIDAMTGVRERSNVELTSHLFRWANCMAIATARHPANASNHRQGNQASSICAKSVKTLFRSTSDRGPSQKKHAFHASCNHNRPNHPAQQLAIRVLLKLHSYRLREGTRRAIIGKEKDILTTT